MTPTDLLKWAGKIPQASAYTKNHRQLRSVQSRRAHLLVIIYQIVSLENTDISSIIQTEQLYLGIDAYTYMHVIINEKMIYIYIINLLYTRIPVLSSASSPLCEAPITLAISQHENQCILLRKT